MAQDDPKREIERDEYKAAVDTYRFFVNLRFVTVAFAMTLQAGLFALYERTNEKPLQLAISSLAIVLIIAIAIIERRTTSLFHDVRSRGRDLERQLGILNGMLGRLIELGKNSWWRKYTTHTTGVGIVYGAIFTLWLFVLGLTLYSTFPEMFQVQQEVPQQEKEKNHVREEKPISKDLPRNEQ